jgi:hypothetical protein
MHLFVGAKQYIGIVSVVDCVTYILKNGEHGLIAPVHPVHLVDHVFFFFLKLPFKRARVGLS